jgi:hypothetical protein
VGPGGARRCARVHPELPHPRTTTASPSTEQRRNARPRASPLGQKTPPPERGFLKALCRTRTGDLYECPWRSSEGQFADKDGGVPVLDFCSCAAPLRGTTPTTPISPGTRTHASRAARAVLPRSRRASSAALRPWQGEGQAGSRGGSRGGASRPLGRRGARRGQRAARASARSPGDLGSRACPSSGSTRWHGAPGARRAGAGRTAKRGRGPRCARRDGGETQRSRIRWLKGGTHAALQLRRCRTPASGPAGAARG